MDIILSSYALANSTQLLLVQWCTLGPAGRDAEVVGSAIDGASQDLGSMTAPALSADPDSTNPTP